MLISDRNSSGENRVTFTSRAKAGFSSFRKTGSRSICLQRSYDHQVYIAAGVLLSAGDLIHTAGRVQFARQISQSQL